ncbi:unnamed protein product [Brassica oleracea var. botrytis]
MAHRLSRGEKEKWIQDQQKQVKRPPVIIPASNNNALIEKHELTLIGRVTNPAIQKTKALNWDVDRGRVRVSINGLKPLEMKLDISLPSGEIKEVELEYENLEKHCFRCLSLTHEGDACPTFLRKENRDGRESRLGISQNRTWKD